MYDNLKKKLMKNFKILAIAGGLLAVTACTDSYIDEIRPVEAGADAAAPEVMVSFPLEGSQIRVVEDVTPITISFEVMDDIEIQEVNVVLDGTNLATFNDFIDYRRFIQSYTYPSLSNGSHRLEVVAKDLSGKTTTQVVNFEKIEPYTPVYEGEVFYLPFDGDYTELVTIRNAEKTGSPSFQDGVSGQAYAGAFDSYISLGTDGFLTQEFSAIFWYKLNGTPDRAGLLVVGPPDPNNPTNQNNRTKGFRFFREAAGSMQRFKLNVGNGGADNWFDGGSAADLDPSSGEWAHLAFTISSDQVTVYINGEIVSQGNFPGVDWSECDILSIGSGAPRFTEWGHRSDQSLFDELRLFNRTLSQTEIQEIMATERP